MNESANTQTDLLNELPPELRGELQAVQRATDTNAIDFSEFRDSSKNHWQDLISGESEEFPNYLWDILRQTTLLPRSHFQLPIIASYLSLASALCTRVPILFSQGASGSGKSQLGYLACSLHGIKPISAGSTFASIRNAIRQQRWYDPESEDRLKHNERHTVLVWEDINPDELRRQEMMVFSLLKNGVERTGTITMAMQGGENMEFGVFAPKLISSIYPVYADFEFREIVRRIIVVEHKRITEWLKEDFSESGDDLKPEDLIDIAEIDWSGFNAEFQKFWNNRSRLQEYVHHLRSLTARRKHGIPDSLYKISKDLIATGVVCGYWHDLETAIAHMKDYWDWHRESIEDQSTATQKVLSRFIEDRTKHLSQLNAKAKEQGLEELIQPIEIDPKELKVYIDGCRANGELDTNGNVKDIVGAMANLGWRQTVNDQDKSVWIQMG